MIRSHVFESSHAAYDVSYTDAIRDGDVLLVPTEDLAGVVVGTSFHVLAKTDNWRDLDGGKYLNSAVVAITLLTIESMKAVGLGTKQALVDIARAHGWAGEIPEQERFAERDDSWGAG